MGAGAQLSTSTSPGQGNFGTAQKKVDISYPPTHTWHLQTHPSWDGAGPGQCFHLWELLLLSPHSSGAEGRMLKYLTPADCLEPSQKTMQIH